MILAIAVLIAAGSFFSVFEYAFAKSKKTHLEKEYGEAEGKNHKKARRYRNVLETLENPGSFLAASCFWIWTLRITASVLAGYKLGNQTGMQIPAALFAGICTAALLTIILFFGELLPRFIAGRRPEHIAALLYPLFRIFTLPFQPLFRKTVGTEVTSHFSPMAKDELHLALEEGERSGIVESNERTMVEGVFYLGDKPLGAFMTHRSEIQWLDINWPYEEIRAKAMENRLQRCFPVADGTLDEIIGAAYLEDIILDINSEAPAGLRAIMKKAVLAPETMPALKAFESFRQGEANFLFVMDEYGGFAGMISIRNLMEEIVGELYSPVHKEEETIRMEDGSWQADGSLNIDEAAELLGLPGLSKSDDYHTLAGFVLSLAGELPHTGDSYEYSGFRFTVLEMDGNRIDKIGIKRETEQT